MAAIFGSAQQRAAASQFVVNCRRNCCRNCNTRGKPVAAVASAVNSRPMKGGDDAAAQHCTAQHRTAMHPQPTAELWDLWVAKLRRARLIAVNGGVTSWGPPQVPWSQWLGRRQPGTAPSRPCSSLLVPARPLSRNQKMRRWNRQARSTFARAVLCTRNRWTAAITAGAPPRGAHSVHTRCVGAVSPGGCQQLMRYAPIDMPRPRPVLNLCSPRSTNDHWHVGRRIMAKPQEVGY